MKVATKREMFAILEDDQLMNHTRIWHNPETLIESEYEGPVAIRSLTAWTKFKPGMPSKDCIDYYYSIIRHCPTTNLVSPSSLIFHEWTPPDSFIAICHLGYCWDDGLELLWSKQTNIAHDQQFATGANAKLKCQDIVGVSNWLKLQDTFDRFPTSVLEFTIHNRGVAEFSEDLTFWEMRDY